MHQSKITLIFLAFALFFVIAAAHHIYEYFDSSLRRDYPPTRHLFVAVINLLIAYFMIKRTKYFVPFLLFICIQQLIGHGASAYQSLTSGQLPHYTDWVIVILMPPLFGLYVYALIRVE